MNEGWKKYGKVIIIIGLVASMFVPDPLDFITAGIPVIEAVATALVAWKYNP